MATRPSRRNRRGVPRGPTSAMPASMPATIPRLPDVAQVPWKVRWLFNWLLFNKLEAVFLLFESALQEPAGLFLVLFAGGLLLAFSAFLWVIFEVMWLCGD